MNADLLTFIIPVRHQDNAADWTGLKARLAQTLASISAQEANEWRAVVVANRGADLPTLPRGVEAVLVDFPPNRFHERGNADFEGFYESFRVDKGRRVLSGMLHARDSRYFMPVDDDDFVSNRIAGHVAAHDGANGWTIDRGYVWEEGSGVLLPLDDFNHLCGTSLIVRSDLYCLPNCLEEADGEWVKAALGSHIKLAEILRQTGTPLATLPFRGAVYRVGHAGSHSGSRGIIRDHLLNRRALARPRQLLHKLAGIRRIGANIRREYFSS